MTFLGFGLSGYRSFSGSIQRIAPFGKVTLLAGANNSGKSNVLTFASDHLGAVMQAVASQRVFAMSGLDTPRYSVDTDLTFSIPFKVDPKENLATAKELLQTRNVGESPEKLADFINKLFRSGAFEQTGDLAWIDVNVSRGGPWFRPESKVVQHLATRGSNGEPIIGPSLREWEYFWRVLLGARGGGLAEHWIPQVLQRLLSLKNVPPTVCRVPAFRQIQPGTPEQYELSGSGMYHMLAKIERPAIDQLKDKQKFERIVDFIRRVTGVSDAMVEVPHDRNTVHVTLDGRTLPIASLGTGIHQVLLLATAATLHDDTLVCLEEPELHLHPLLQKELLRYLDCNTSNQYLISTHSAHFLNSEGAAVFHARNVEGRTHLQVVKSPEDQLEVCRRLGYHASDLLQTNAVIWVEGPSDRIYLLEWLRQVAPDLQEGYQFSVMFYGGRLLSNLTAAEELEGFLHLRKLNRHFAVIMDSDKRKGGDPIGATKQRICSELAGTGCVSWTTEVRTIENYVPRDAWIAAAKHIHPSARPVWNGSRFTDPFAGLPKSPDKIALAEHLRQNQGIDATRHDLPAKLAELVEMIRRANPSISVD